MRWEGEAPRKAELAMAGRRARVPMRGKPATDSKAERPQEEMAEPVDRANGLRLAARRRRLWDQSWLPTTLRSSDCAASLE